MSMLPVDLEAIRSIRAEERHRLMNTVALYLETGSIKETALALYCHRNTVVKHLSRFESLTGLNIGIPSSASREMHATTRGSLMQSSSAVVASRLSACWTPPNRRAARGC